MISLMLISSYVFSQKPDAQYPIIKSYGGIYPIGNATVLPDPDEVYNIVVEIKSCEEDASKINSALINIARLLNLHALGGVKKENLHVVAIVHGPATTSIMNESSYKKRFKVSNPNSGLIKELLGADVRIIICGQSMLARNVSEGNLIEGIEISISMLTAYTTFQLQGYAALTF